MNSAPHFDVAIVGAGPAGVIALTYAKAAGLTPVVFERQSEVGGLWAQLPSWQDIQNREEDWTLGEIPISGVKQQAIVENIRAWVSRFELAPHIRLGTSVESAAPTEDGWEIRTPAGIFRSTFLISATGVHNRPFTPVLPRVAVELAEYHSSNLHDPSVLTGQRVVVIGGGASAFDLVDLALGNQAAQVIWIYRSLKWFAPTLKAKRFASNVRELSRLQLSGGPVEEINRQIDADLRARYARFKIEALLPDHPFDIERDQLIPGRRGLIEHLAKIERHRYEPVAIEGRRVKLSSGATIDADVILWGTGYQIDLGYLKSIGADSVSKPDDLAKRCGTLVKSLDAPNLFFLSVGLDSTSATPWHYAHLARTIVSSIKGACDLGSEPVTRHLNYIGAPMLLAQFDPTHYRPDVWRAEYEALLVSYPNEKPMPLPIYLGASQDRVPI